MENYIYTFRAEDVIRITANPRTYPGADWGEDNKVLPTEFRIDLTNPYHEISMVKAFENEGDSAFFYQFRKAVCYRNGNNERFEDRELLKDKVVIFDFESLFNRIDFGESLGNNMRDESIPSEVVETIDEDGYYKTDIIASPYENYFVSAPTFDQLVKDLITFSKIEIAFEKDGDNRPVWHRFVVFDKSQSMARNSRILFVDADYLSMFYMKAQGLLTLDLSGASGLTRMELDKKLDSMDISSNPYDQDCLPVKPYEDYLVESLLNTIDDEDRVSLSLRIIRVILPCGASEYREILSGPREVKTDYDEDGLSIKDTYCPLIENEAGNILYYIPEEAWVKISGKDIAEKICTLKDGFGRLQNGYLDRRLNLGIDFHGITLTLSKLYAYRGLFLSTSTRIEGLELNEKTVIVIPDQPQGNDRDMAVSLGFEKDFNYSRETPCITNTYEITGEGKVKAATVSKDCLLKNETMFDGEGLISLDFAEIIKQKTGREKAVSFQVRMPFIKGVLHTVDFKGFMDEFSCGNYIIKDVFGRKRDLREAEIILTESMFKAAKWIRELWKKYNKLHSDSKIEDPMQFFFERMKEFDHTFYLRDADDSYKHGSITSLNYQILNTLALEKEELETLVMQQWKCILNPAHVVISNEEKKDDEGASSDDSDDTITAAGSGTTDNAAEDDKDTEASDGFDVDGNVSGNDPKTEEEDGNTDGGTEDDGESGFNTWMAVLKKNKDFRFHPYIKTQLGSTRKSLQLDIAYGRLQVPGEVRYLSRDLLLLLKYLLELILLCGISDKCQAEKELLESIRYVDRELLPADSFYAPKRGLKYKYGQYYPVFRNPHLSRNEQCALKYCNAEAHSVRDDYLGKLNGVLMVSGESFAPKTLGGADFDGDFVKVFDSSEILNAVKRGVYDKDWNRRLPVIDINDKPEIPVANIEVEYRDRIDYPVLYNTFANSVGRISNLAVDEGQKRFQDKYNEEASECAIYTILTGLEIDACKSGRHPYLEDPITNPTDYIHGFKNVLDKLNAKNISLPSYKDIETGNGRIIYQKGRNILVVTDYADQDARYDSLSYLEYLFMFGLMKNCFLPDPDKTKEIEVFERELDKDEKKIKERFKVSEKISEDEEKIIAEHLDRLLEERKDHVNRKANLARRKAVFRTICYIYQLKGLDKKDTVTVINALGHLLPDSSSGIADIIDRLKESDWPYLDNDADKESELMKLLNAGNGKHIIGDMAVLYDYRSYGYYLLYMFLEFIRCTIMEKEFGHGRISSLDDLSRECIKNLQEKFGKDTFQILYRFKYFRRQKRDSTEEEKTIDDRRRNLAEKLLWQCYSADEIVEGISNVK